MSTQTGPVDPGRRWGLPHLALLVPWVAMVIGAFKSVRDNSFLWHIRAGELQIGLGSVLTEDPFSFTRRGDPWLTQSWLADIFYSWAHDGLGIGFTSWMVFVLALITLTGVGILVYRMSGSVTATALLGFLTALLLVPVMVPRPVLFTFPIFVMVVMTWETRRLRWALPFLFWLWASVHGSFILGLLYIFLRWLAVREWRAWPFGLVSGLATLLTAHGLGTVTTVLTFVSMSEHLELMMEWQTPDFLSPVLAPFMIGLLLILVGGMRGRVNPSAFWIVIPFGVLALSASRGVLPSWLALVPVTAAAMAGVHWRESRGFPLPVATIAAAMILFIPLPFIRPAEVDASVFPVAAAHHLLDERTFHDDGSGGYFIYSGQFSEGVYIDDRVELYQEGIREFVDIRAGRAAWEPHFAELGLEQALVPTEGPLHRLLLAAGWREYYRDARHVILRLPS